MSSREKGTGSFEETREAQRVRMGILKGEYLMLSLSFLLGFQLACSQEQPTGVTPPAEETPAKEATTAKEEKVEDFSKAPADVASPPADAQKTASGLAYKTLASGTGTEHPSASSRVSVHYTGWTTDGKMFDSSKKRNKPSSFGLDQVIAGWTEGLQLMTVGQSTRFWIPEELAYKGQKGRPAGMLVFDVELLEIVNPPKTPEDVASPPADASKTASGIAYNVLKEGTGGQKPTEKATVQVHYTGWTTDGEMFDSSTTRGTPTTFPLNKVIPGWTEGLQLMTIGEKTRFWIPEELAYKGKPGRPQGMLVFDVELLEIKEPVKAPADVASPPSDAKKTASGLAYKSLEKGKGSKNPTGTSRVKVHYTGWTTDGEMFDSSEQRGTPASFGLNRVIPGWTEGLQLMTEGEKTRFWIPEELAYKGKAGRPQGMLVFDVQLLEILN
jgi:FKBP-type peptidyl-prolyl cis-trans isomerase